MPLLFKARWNVVPARHQGANDVPMMAALDNSEEHIQAIVFEAWRAGGYTEGTIAAMLTQANAPAGAQVNVRQGLHQVEDQGQHGDGFNLHIGTKYQNVNFHINLHQTDGGRLYASSVSYGNNPNRVVQDRPNPAPG